LCIKGRCVCVEPFIEYNGACILDGVSMREVGPGEQCANGERCTRGSVCDPMIPICICPPGTVLQGSVCMPGTSLSTLPPMIPTIAPTSAPFNYSFTFPSVSQQWTTKPSTLKLQYGGDKKAGVGVQCTINTDCMIGAYCKGNTNPPTCQCLSTHVNVNSRCEKVIYPGQKGCDHDLQCSAAYVGTKCVSRQCVCPQGFKAIEQTCLSGFAYPGSPCDSSLGVDACSSQFVCINSLCQCPPPLIEFQRQCINKTDIRLSSANSRQKCRSADECPPDLKCLNGKCDCLPGLIRNGTSCHKPKRSYPTDLNGMKSFKFRLRKRSLPNSIRKQHGKSIMECWPDQHNCANGKGVCLEDVCHCIDGYVKVDGECRPEVLPLNSSCEKKSATSQCGSDADCIHGICTCIKPSGCGQERRSGTAVALGLRTLNLGTPCTSGDACPKGMLCLHSTCQCAEGFFLQDGECRKTSATFKPINSQCSEDDRCMGGSVCSSSICSCIDGSVEAFGRCRQRPGGRCANGETCAANSVCELAICRCPDGYRLEDSHCLATVAMPGRSCQKGQKCANGSQCRFGVCMCAANYRIIGDRCERLSNIIAGTTTQSRPISTTTDPPRTRSARVIAVKPGQMCMDGEVCIGGARCVSGFCVCTDGELIINDECVGSQNKATQVIKKEVKAAPGQYCNEETTCTGGSVCLANVCTCPSGTNLAYGECALESTTSIAEYTTETSVTEQRTAGSLCRLNTECPFRTECVRGVCRCKRGETLVGGLCRKAVYEVQPGGICNPWKGLDCIGESYCMYGTCMCTGGLVSTGFECASSMNEKVAKPGQSCAEGQICTGGSRCTGRVCECGMIEVIDENGQCILPAQPLYTSSDRPPPRQTSHYASFNTLSPRGNDGSNDEGMQKMNQYLNASHVTIAVLDRDTFKALFGTQTANSLCGSNSCTDKSACIGANCLSTNNDQFSQNIGQNGNLQSFIGAQWQTAVTPSVLTIVTKPTYTSNFLPTTQTPFFEFRTGVPGEGCTPQGFCSNGAFCTNFLCTCMDGYILLNRKCQPRAVALHVNCEADLQCPTNAFCDNRICACKSAYIEKQGVCIADYGARPGEDCSEGRQCGYGAYCGATSGVCECPAGMATIENMCRPAVAPLGPACITSANCDRTSYCDNGYCLCKDGYFWDGQCCVASSLSQFNMAEPSQAKEASLNAQNHHFSPTSNELFPMFPSENIDDRDQNGAYGIHQSPMRTSRNSQESQQAFMSSLGAATFYKQNGIQNTFGINPVSIRQSKWPFAAGTDDANRLTENLVPMKRSSLAHNNIDEAFTNGEATNVAHLPSYSMHRFQPEGKEYVHGIDDRELWMGSPWNLRAEPSDLISDGDTGGLSMLSPPIQQFPQHHASILPVPLERPPTIAIHPAAQLSLEPPFSVPMQPSPPLPIGPPPQLLLHSINSQLLPMQNLFPVEAEALAPPYYLRVSSFPFRAFRASPTRGAVTMNFTRSDGMNIYEQVAMPGEYCGQRQMCLGNAICKFDWCRCREGHTLENGVCVQLVDNFPSTVNDGNTENIAQRKQIARPFESCSNFEECLAGSYCSSLPGYGLVCLCPKENFLIEDKCQMASDDIDIAVVGEICDSNTICVDGAVCNFGECVCPNGKTNVSNHCVVTASPGEMCGQGQLCVGSSLCAEGAHICVCPAGTKLLFDKCVELRAKSANTEKLSVDAKCNNDDDDECAFGAYCSERKRCECRENFFKLNGKCIETELIRWPGDTCDDRTFCYGESFCDDRLCKCLNGNIAIDNSCYSIAKKIRRIPIRRTLHQMRRIAKRIKKSTIMCHNDTHCTTNVSCNDPTCLLCKVNGTLNVDNCIHANNLTTKAQSTKVYNCSDDVCHCGDGFIAIKKICVPLRLPSESCEGKSLCGYGAICKHGYCICERPSILHKGECIEIYRSSNPGASCHEQENCIGGSICIKGHCVCDRGYYPGPKTDRCISLETTFNSLQRYDDSPPCFETSLCEHRNSSCANGKDCISKEDGKSFSPPGGSCYEAQECTGGSTPTTMQPVVELKWLTSSPSTHDLLPISSLSVTTRAPFVGRKAVPGSNCGPLDECVGGSMCIEGVCICPAGLSASELTARCEPNQSATAVTQTPAVRFASPNEPCANGEICTGGAMCSDGKICLCPTDTPRIVDDKCTGNVAVIPTLRRTANPGQQCDAQTECIGQSVCQQGICRCLAGYFLLSGKCVQVPVISPTLAANLLQPSSATLGQACGGEVICTGGSSCTNGICVCSANQIASDGVCVTVSVTAASVTQPTVTVPRVQNKLGAVEGTQCDDDTQCSDNRICIVNRCKCKTGFVERDGTCKDIQEIIRNANNASTQPTPHLITVTASSTTWTRPEPAPRPRITGPPIRLPWLVTTPPSQTTAIQAKLTRTGSVGVCPASNEPVIDQSTGKLLMCNGMKPKCPPGSYCYVTGYASGQYNCCKSW
uniref:Prion-like-(Q/N-rich) domain-bearing protein 25 n=1 Tax=Toxocara canis TaxID=6265 RepID=A0A183V6J2_TOXCA